MAPNKQKILASAQKYVRKGNLARAIKEYERLLDIDPTDVRVRLKVGDLYAKKGDVDDAIATYRQVAKLHAKAGFLLKAAAVYKRILQLDPKNLQTHMRLGDTYHQLGLMSDAMSYLNTGANVAVALGDVAAYADILRKMAQVDPENVGIRIKLAEHYSKHEFTDEALEEFNRAADMLRDSGRTDDFVKVAERLVFLDPNALERVRQLVEVYQERREHKRALAKLQLLFNAEPENTETLTMLIDVFKALGQRDKALQVMREKARLHEQRSERLEARQAWEAILDVDDSDQEALDALGLDQPVDEVVPMLSSDLLAPMAEAEMNVEIALPGTEEGYHPPASHVMPAVRPEEIEARRSQLGRPQMPGQPQIPPPPVMPGRRQESTAPLTPAPPQMPSRPQMPGRSQGMQDDPGLAVDVDRLLIETDVFLRYKLFDQATEHLQKVFRVAPNHIEALEKQKQIYVANGQRDQAIGVLHRLANSLLATERVKAVGFIKEVLRLHPQHIPTLQLANQLGIADYELYDHLARPQDVHSGESVEDLMAQVQLEVADEQNTGANTLENDEGFKAETDMYRIAEFTDSEEVRQAMAELQAEGSFDIDIEDDILIDDADLQDIDVDLDASGIEVEDIEVDVEDHTEAIDVQAVSAGNVPSLAQLNAALGDGGADMTAQFSLEHLMGVASQDASGYASYDEDDEDLLFLDDDEDDDAGSIQIDAGYANEYSHSASYDGYSHSGSNPHLSGSGQHSQQPYSHSDPAYQETNNLQQVHENDDPTVMGQLAGDPEALRLDLEEVDFYLEQGMTEDAQRLLNNLERQWGALPEIASRRNQLQAASPAPQTPHNGAANPLADEAVIALIPAHVRRSSHFELGLAYRNTQALPDAIGEFRQAIEEGLQVPHSFLLIGQCLVELGRLPEAIQYIQESLRYAQTPEVIAHAHYRLGRVFELAGNHRDAMNCFARIENRSDLFPDLPQRMVGLRTR